MSEGRNAGELAVLDREFYRRSALDVAPELLNKVVVRGNRSGRIVEVEAYLQNDPASHTYRGETPRTTVMFGPPGRLYVYFTYGMHWCANAVVGEEGDGTAVLIRAIEPLTGIAEMRIDRPAARRDRDLTNGPAKLCGALGIDGELNGADLCDATGPIVITHDDTAPPNDPVVGPRIGISVAVDLPYRFGVPDHPYLSKPFR